MENKLLLKKHALCCQLVIEKKIYEAFAALQELMDQAHNSDLQIRLDNHHQTYTNILRYSFGEVEDPEKKTVYYHLLRSLLELADDTLELTLSGSRFGMYKNHQNWTADNFAENITNLAPISGSKRSEEIEQMFNYLWLSSKFHESEASQVGWTLLKSNLQWWEKCLVISALTLSLQRNFDEAKILLLIDAYKSNEEQIWQRALVSVFLALFQYNDRLFLYPALKKQMEELRESQQFVKYIETIIIQLIKTRDTEKIAHKFRDEIMPEMVKYHSRMYDKLDMRNVVQDLSSEEENPDWENIFEDSPNLMNELMELSKLQMEGSDVMMGTFSMLKQFPFFDELSNWFIPFHKEDWSVRELLKDDSGTFDAETFLKNMENSFILCNSDKYSFCLNVNRIPVRERDMMVGMFNMEANAMEEDDMDNKVLQKPEYQRKIFTQHIQDLYRFYKLYRNKSEFYDVFSTDMDFHNKDFLAILIKDAAILRNIGEFYFEKKYYKDAIEVFHKIDTNPENIELWQKIAYSWQKLGNYQKALEYYLKADLTDIRKSWNIKKIAFCYKRLGNYDKALQYYLEAEKMEPEDLQVQANLAHTYFEMNDFDNALKIYFKVEYLAPDNHKIQRPIGWCSFMLGKFDTARKYFQKVIDNEPNEHDLLNLGHVEWCSGNKQGAIEKYFQSIQRANGNFDWFGSEFVADSDILIRNGIDPFDLPLMLDYLRFFGR
jgi:tetratricopeptide (TPR) repeat protein